MKNTKVYIITALYILLLIIECVIVVPCNYIQIFRTVNNVPHEIIVGSGYAKILDISYYSAELDSDEWVKEGTKVNTPQLITNMLVTTFIYAALLFFTYHENNIQSAKQKLSSPGDSSANTQTNELSK